MDNFDKKIIEILDKNSRLPLSKMSKVILLSKQSIARRIENLYRVDQLFSYYLIVNYFKLDLSNAVLFLSFNNINKEKLHQKVKELERISSIGWIADFFGTYDIGISIFYQSSTELNQTINEIQDIFGDAIKETLIINMVEHAIFSFVFSKKERANFHISQNKNTKQAKISSLQTDILHELSKSTRDSATAIAQRLGISSTVVRYNIKQLEKNKIINGYKLLINFSKFGFNWGLIFFSCNHSPELNNLVAKLKNDSRVILISKSVTNDLLVDVLYNQTTELKEFVEEYKTTFSNIYNSRILNVIHVHKLGSYLK